MLKMRQPNANPMFDMLYKNELCGKHIIDLPAPFDGTADDMRAYCRIYAKAVGEAYRVI